MTIQEAINSGKPFKRPDWQTWVMPHFNAIFHKTPRVLRSGSYGSKVHFATKNDMMADDWIVQDKLKEDLTAAIANVLRQHAVSMVPVLSGPHGRDPNENQYYGLRLLSKRTATRREERAERQRKRRARIISGSRR